MIIALDATPLTVPTGGVLRYTCELSQALAREFPEDEFWLLSDQPFASPPARAPNLHVGAGPRSIIERKWWLWGVEREMSRCGAEVFHGTDFSVPYLKRRPSVMTLHDLSPWREERWQPDASRVRRRTPALLRTGAATIVITPSEAVRREAIPRFRLDPDRVRAVPLAAGVCFRPSPVRLWPRPYYLFVGTLEPRKNIARLIEAWRAAKATSHADLVLAGRIRADFAVPAEEPGLHILGAIPDRDLPAWYSGAIAVVYPSLYEGFGLPVLEAMQCGALVITSRDPAILEVSNGCAIHFDAHNTAALAEAMSAVASGGDRFLDLRAKALARAREFTWPRTARRTREVYEDAQRIFRKS